MFLFSNLYFMQLLESDNHTVPRLGTKSIQLDTSVEFSIEVELRDFLRSKVIGQNTSTDRLASIIASRMYSLAPRTGPLAVIYIPGPSGTGKTETCHALAEYFFNDPKAFVKISGEDLQDNHASRNIFG
jgi:ATP-dependent Clp protease ATP-binding subunit ClpA